MGETRPVFLDIQEGDKITYRTPEMSEVDMPLQGLVWGKSQRILRDNNGWYSLETTYLVEDSNGRQARWINAERILRYVRTWL